MKIFFACITMCIVLLSIASAPAPALARQDFMEVSRSDGSLQCGDGPAMTLDAAVVEVEAAGVEVGHARTIHDGKKRIALCGASTGNIHVLMIGSGDLEVVEAMGFEIFETN